MAGFEGTDRGERSTEMQGWCRGEGLMFSNDTVPSQRLWGLGEANWKEGCKRASEKVKEQTL